MSKDRDTPLTREARGEQPETRMPREHDTREKQARKMQWREPSLLPDPNPEPGYAFRWIRASALGVADPQNISAKMREGWEPVKASDHPEIVMNLNPLKGNDSRDLIEIGGLVLCKTPVELVEQRDAHFLRKAEGQQASVDNTLMRESNPKMPIFQERSSRFGKGFQE